MHITARHSVPALETVIYLTVWPCILTCVIYQVYLECQIKSTVNEGYLAPGWSVLGNRKQDVSDFEWHLWHRIWGPRILPWIIVHAALSLVFRHSRVLTHQNRRLFYLPFSLLCCCHLLGWRSVVFLLVRAIFCYFIVLVRKTWLVWANYVFLLTTLNMEYLSEKLKDFHSEPATDAVVPQPCYNLLLIVIALFDTRLVSFSLEKCRQVPPSDDKTRNIRGKDKIGGAENNSRHAQKTELKSSNFKSKDVEHGVENDGDINGASEGGFMDMLVYVFYLPVFYTGPLLTYDKFYQQFTEPDKCLTSGAIYSALRELARLCFWLLFVEFSLHYMHISAIELSGTRLYYMDAWRLGGCGYLQVYFFLIKYLLIYGIAGLFSRADGITTPAGPVCIEVLYSISQVWRTFDRGYYAFMKRYIYLPLGGSRHGLTKQLIGVLLTFIFVYLWHGTDSRIFVWAMYNVIMISYERVGLSLVKFTGLEAYLETEVSPAWQRRLAAVAGIPMSLMTIHSMFVFISGPSVGLLFLKKFLLENAQSGWLLPFLCVVYLRNNCCYELHRRFYWRPAGEHSNKEKAS